MEKKILEFAVLLRKAGVPAASSEVVDGLESLALVGLEKKVFYNALAATLIKDQGDMRVFDKVFDYFFSPDFFGHQSEQARHWPGLLPAHEEPLGCTGNDPAPDSSEKRSTGFGQGRGMASAPVEKFVQVVKIGNDAEMTSLVRQGINSLGELTERDLVHMKETLRHIKVFLEWNMGVDRLNQETGKEDENLRLIWQERLSRFEEILYREVEKALFNKFGESALQTILVRENLNEIDFFRLSAPQVEEIKKKIGKLAHKLASRLAFRYKRAKFGKVDLARTIRKAAAYGGVPIRPAFRNRYPTRPEFVVLCDVSGSVKTFSEFMLQLVFSIQTRFLRVRSFAFVDIPDEVTDYFQNREVEDAIREMYNKGRFSMSAFSDYGRVFREFWVGFGDIIGRQTTLLLIGDARNNYNPSQAEFFQRLSQRAGRVIWLNPAPRENWDQEDSIMSVYGSYCSQVFECRNLRQLETVSKMIV